MRASPTTMVSGGSPAIQAIVQGGLVAGALDATNGVVAYFLAFKMKPIQVLQYIASGLLGQAAFAGGLATAGVGLLVHFAIAFSVAAVFWFVSDRWPLLRERALAAGLVYGTGVYLVMNYVVLPFLSRVAPGWPTLPLFLNGVIGHALFVGLPVSLAARRARTGGRPFDQGLGAP